MKFAHLSFLALLWIGTAAPAQDLRGLRFYPEVLPYRVQGYGASQKIYLYGIPVRPLGMYNARKRWVRNFLRNGGAREALLSFLKSDHWKVLKETTPLSWTELDGIPLDQLEQDLRNSPYLLKKSCLDGKPGGPRKSKEASTGYVRNAPVCFNAGKLVKSEEIWNENWMKAKLAALVLHEHLHHFGVRDSANWMYEALTILIFRSWEDKPRNPFRVAVTAKFAEYRQRFRDAVATGFTLRKPQRYRCDYQTRGDGGSGAYQNYVEPLVKRWFSISFEVRPSPISKRRWEFVHPMNGESQLSVVPQCFQHFESPFVDTLVATPFGQYDPEPVRTYKGEEYQVQGSASVLIRPDSDGSLLFEIGSAGKEVGSPTRLPSAANSDAEAAAYARCTVLSQ